MKEKRNSRLQSHIEHILLDEIIILSQMRKTYDDIPRFAKEIFEAGGVFQNIVVAELSREEAKQYIEYVNIVCGSKKSIYEFKKASRYKILIAGHRRTKACKNLDRKGLFVKIAPKRMITARVFPNIDVRTALKMQNLENKRKDIKPVERAEHLQNWFKTEQILRETKLSMREFSKICGEPVREISRAILFARLPEKIKNAVSEKVISYPRACELARVFRLKKASEEDRKNIFALVIVNNNFRGKALRKYISALLRSEMESSAPLFDEEERQKVRTTIRKTLTELVGMEKWKAHSAGISFHKRIDWLFENNFLDLSAFPYLKKDVERILLADMESFEKIRDSFRILLKKRKYAKSKKTMDEIRASVKKLQYATTG